MDSFSYRDSARSPGDRGWSSRDDSRIKDERGYRSRSPGGERSRRRSRSPAQVDRYEPRGGRGRDDYGGTRDRDDRSRRMISPPANIDRYVPGQDSAPPQPLTNPIPDPLKLNYQVGFSYYAEWWRANEKIKEEKERLRTGRRREPDRVKGPREITEEREKIQAAYDAYKEELQAKMAQTFVKQHKEEQWFRERYVPEVRDPLRAQLNEYRREAYVQWEDDLRHGHFDEISLEGIPKNESNGAGGAAEKEEGEATGNEVLGVGDLVPVNNADIKDDAQFQPTLLIKTIAPSVSRHNLEAFCKEHLGEGEGGFKWLSLSDPNPSKRYHRIGWILLNPASKDSEITDEEIKDEDVKDEDLKEDDDDHKSKTPQGVAQKALELINGKTVKDEQRGDFTCHVGVHNPPVNPRKKALWDLFSAPDRINRDLELAVDLIKKFEGAFGSEFNANLLIEEHVEDMRAKGDLKAAIPSSPIKKEEKKPSLDEAMDVEVEEGEEPAGGDDDEDEGMVDDEVDDIDLLVTKKRLDLSIEYLRRVFNFCLFCVFESDSIHELSRKCPGGHLRRPRSTLSSAAKAVARASALNEPFPSKKRKDTEDIEEGEAPDPDRKFRTKDKTEQQLQRAYNWVKTYEDKLKQILTPDQVDLKKLGGKPIEDAVNDELVKYVKQEDEHKWRCKVPECTKLFKEDHFWRKHVEKRHPEWLEKLKEEFELINAYVLDPAHIAPSRTDANSNGHFPANNGQQPTGTPRGFNLQNYAMNGMLNFSQFPMPIFPPNMMSNAAGQMNAAAGGWQNSGGDDRGSGPIRRGGPQGGGGGRYQNRAGPYDRRQNPRWGGGGQDGAGGNSGGGRGRNAGSAANRWGDGGAPGGAAMGPREAVQGRTLKSYEDLDQVAGGGGGELNY